MPLNASALSSGLASLFSNPPPSAAACAEQRASAAQSWAAGIVPPSAAVAAAKSALQSALAGAFGAPNAAPAMESAFASFAVTVGGGMAGYVPTPPAGPVGFAAQFDGPKPATANAAASAIASKIDVWMKTGIATLVAPPNTVVPWT
jgi:hypothetical protein